MNNIGLYQQKLFDKMPVIGILRNFSIGTIEEILPSYKKAGFTTLEITMNSKNACETIRHFVTNCPNMNIGAGTVCSMKDLGLALDAGASFIVTPILNEEVVAYCVKNNIPIFPGAYTPLEVYNAAQTGASIVKLFPATQLGTRYIKDILAPLNTVKLLPTGGVDVNNISSFFEAGAVGVGMGSSLFDSRLIADREYKKLYLHFQEIASKVRLFVQ